MPEGSSEISSSSNPVVFGSTISAISDVGVIMCDATARKSRDRSAAITLRVSGYVTCDVYARCAHSAHWIGLAG